MIDAPNVSILHLDGPRGSHRAELRKKHTCSIAADAMNFCPFPQSLRDQAWLAVGVGLLAAHGIRAQLRRINWSGTNRHVFFLDQGGILWNCQVSGCTDLS